MSISRNFFHVSTEIWALSLFLSLSSYLSSLSVHLFVYLSIYCVRYTTLIQSTTVIIIPSMQLFFAYLPMPLILSVTVYPIIYLTFFFTSYTTLCIYKSLNFCLFITLSNLLRARICYTHKFTYRNIHRHTYFASVCVCTRVCADMHIHAHAHTWEYTHRSFSVCL